MTADRQNENNHNGSKHQRRLYLHRILIYHLKSQIHQHNTKTLSPQTLNLLAGNFTQLKQTAYLTFTDQLPATGTMALTSSTLF